MTAIFQFAERFTEKPRLGQMCTLMIARTVFQKQTQCFAGPGDEPAETT